MTESIDQFFLSQTEPNRSCLLALRDIVLDFHKNISETQKYGMPCYCFGKKALVYLWTDKKTDEPYILVVDGNLIDHPLLEQGSRSRMKILRVNPREDINLSAIQAIMKQALLIHENKG